MDIRLGAAGLKHTDGQTDMANIISGLRDYASRPKKVVANLLPKVREYLLTSLHYITLSEFTV
jgi:hypothetical protein